MKNIKTFLLVTCALALAASQVLGQARRIPPTPPGSGGGTSAAGDVRAASVLYEEASGYAGKKFQEFAAKKLPFDPRVLEQTLKEQKELAARYAAELYARPNLSGEDLYYMGLLYNVSANEERTIETFKRFLGRDKTEGGERPQYARYVLAQRLAQVGRTEEAEGALADYLRFEPRKQSERVTLENALAKSYRKARQFDRAASHAEESFKAAKSLLPKAQQGDSTERLLSTSSILLVGIYQQMKKPAEASAGVLEEVRKLSLELPSPRLYVDATIKLADVLLDAKRKPDAIKTVEDAVARVKTDIKNEKDQRYMIYGLERKRRQLALQGEAAPEITVAKWIEQAPVKMSDLRGRVVLLDFWATWCGPCLASFPQLKEWHEKYRDRGLVILGLTRYYGGRGAGKALTKDEEFTYLERFKKQYDLPYGVAVTDTDNNHDNYGVQAIPTTVLIDRHGVIRFLATGVGGGNEAEIAENIEKLLEEK